MTGYYSCIAKNELGKDTTKAGLTVNKALSPEEKARLEELAEAEKNKALQMKKEAEEKKKKLEELQQQQKEQHRLQQEQRKAARSAKKEAPKEEIGVQLKKKAPAQKDAQAPDLPQLKRVEQNKRAESPMRTASPIPKLKSVALRTPTGSREGTPVKEIKKEPELKPALKKPKPEKPKEKKAPPQKSAPPPSVPKEEIKEQKAKEETIVEKDQSPIHDLVPDQKTSVVLPPIID